jgi:aerobic-type carbon monoxide dehydrogenase small subunit (CoxS/CutS family)
VSAGDLRIGGDAGRGARVRLTVDGHRFHAYAGESLSTALWAAGVRELAGGIDGPPSRPVFCAMGICQQCAVWIDGRRVEACRTQVYDGLVATSVPPEP